MGANSPAVSDGHIQMSRFKLSFDPLNMVEGRFFEVAGCGIKRDEVDMTAGATQECYERTDHDGGVIDIL